MGSSPAQRLQRKRSPEEVRASRQGFPPRWPVERLVNRIRIEPEDVGLQVLPKWGYSFARALDQIDEAGHAWLANSMMFDRAAERLEIEAEPGENPD